MSEKLIWTSVEISKATGVSTDWLIAEAEANRLPCLIAPARHGGGKRYLFHLPAVERRLAERIEDGKEGRDNA